MKYNFDALSKYLMVIGAVFLLAKNFRLLGLVFIVYALWRGFSNNRFKRSQELAAFERMIFILKQKIYTLRTNFTGKKNYKVFICPNCSQKLRIPRRKGKITITCSRCQTKFKGKS